MAPPERWFEDFAPGQVFESGEYLLGEAEIIDFARRYDPQPFHTDPVAAQSSAFGGLIASGWNTAAIAMRLLVDGFVPANSSLGSPGVDELRWTRPVRPGDRLRLRVTVTETRLSRSKPDRGLVRTQSELLNQDGEVVMTLRGMGLFRVRPAPAPVPVPVAAPAPVPAEGQVGPFPRRSLGEIFHAKPGDPLRGLAEGTQTGEAMEVALPPLRIGARLMPTLEPQETPGGARWNETSYRSMIPWVCSFNNVRVHGDGGIVVGAGVVVSDTLVQVEERVQGFAHAGNDIVLLGRPEAERLEGAWLSLLCGSHSNYYHWLIDGIGRLAAADATTLAGCAGVLIPANLAPSAAQTVMLSGIERGLQVRMVGPHESMQVPRLVVPWRLADGFWPHPALRRYLSELVPQAPRNPSLPPRIYIDRRGAARRRLVNEDEIIAALAGAGVVPIRLETLSLAAQVALFRQAELVVAPHGAGLTNVIFARPECAVVELVMDRYQHWCFRRLAALGGLDYDCVPGRALPGQVTEWEHDLSWQVSPSHVVSAVVAALGR